jgi:chromosomal replication initiator protein
MPDSVLEPRYTFDNFVTGETNEAAHVAAKAVACQPAQIHNPLYLYGGVGTGKTHLLHAIDNTVQPVHDRAFYRNSYQFVNRVVEAFRQSFISRFRDMVPNIDVLLFDDCQFLLGKPQAQQEFLRMFDTLHALGRQIAITGDQPPRQLAGIDERLIDRLEGGLALGIGKADEKLKISILQRKASDKNAELPADVAAYIAAISSTARELDGAFNSLLAHCMLTQEKLTLETARHVLKVSVPKPELSFEDIQQKVAEKFRLRPSKLSQKSNSPTIVLPRQIVMYLAKRLTELSLAQIGRQFGKHHTTVLHAVQAIEEKRRASPELNERLISLEEALTRSIAV